MADHTSVKQMSLESLMEVVTSYKCRFCDHTSTSIGDMTNHLQTTHVVSQSDSVKPIVSASTEIDGQETGKSSNPDPDQACDEDSVVEKKKSTVTFETPALLSHLGLASTASPGTSFASLVRSSLPDPNVLTDQVRGVAKSLPMAGVSQKQEVDLFTLTSSTATSGTQNAPITSLQLSGAGLTLATVTTATAGSALDGSLTFPSGLTLAASTTTIDTITLPAVDSSKDLGTGPASIVPPPTPPSTREYFLCGTCNVGFVSMDECRLHMVQEHNAHHLQGGSVSDTIVDRLEQRVSVGTQATGKRPGRKRKSDLPPQSPPQRIKKSAVEDDADWLPGRRLSSGNRDGQQRRRIRAPKALMQDYVIEPKRKYRKRQVLLKETYTLSCSFLGCTSKFRCQEALDIHLECHNKVDEAFTCIKCNNLFDVWKSLRIHLWREHSIDCDMFQCDLCEYKTDTAHKLGVHREIHSDNRPYTCDLCGKGFKQLSQMKNHQIIHTDQRRQDKATSWHPTKSCSVCKRTFANSKCLKKHVEAVHGQSKPYKCNYCNHSTAWKAMIILHERTHTGEKPFKCDICTYATGDHNSLRRHKMRHSGKKQYQCKLCSYTCIQTISLKTHMQNKHPNTDGIIYFCPKCKYKSINKAHYENHLMDHNNGLITDTKMEDSDTSYNSQTTTSLMRAPLQFQLQVKRTDTGELHANKDDIDRLDAMPQFSHSGMDANQLIYSALNVSLGVDKESVIPQNIAYTAQLMNGTHCTVTPTQGTPGNGVAYSYLITFIAAPKVSIISTASSTPTTGIAAGQEESTALEASVSQDGDEAAEAMTGSEISSTSRALDTGSQAVEAMYTDTTQATDMEGSSSQNQSNISGSSSSSDFTVVQVAFDDETGSDDAGKVSISTVSTETEGEAQMGLVTEGGQVVQGVIVGNKVMVIEDGQLVERVVVMTPNNQGSIEVAVDEVAGFSIHPVSENQAATDNALVEKEENSF